MSVDADHAIVIVCAALFFVTVTFAGTLGGVARKTRETMALVEAAREGATVSTAVRQGWRLLGSRLGSILLLFVLQLVAGMVLGAVFAPVAIISSLAMRDQPGLDLAVRMPLQLVQWVISVAVQLVFQAAYVALARDTWPPAAAVPLPSREMGPAAPGVLAFGNVADDPMPEIPDSPSVEEVTSTDEPDLDRGPSGNE